MPRLTGTGASSYAPDSPQPVEKEEDAYLTFEERAVGFSIIGQWTIMLLLLACALSW